MSAAKRKREAKLIGELVRSHGYMFAELSRRTERVTMQYTRNKKTGKSLVVPAVCIKLIVPAKSSVGRGIIEIRKGKQS